MSIFIATSGGKVLPNTEFYRKRGLPIIRRERLQRRSVLCPARVISCAGKSLPRSHLLFHKPVRRSHPSVPEPRILHRPLLVAEIHVRETVPLRVAIVPLEVIQGTPGVKRPYIRAVPDRARQFREF